ncbi:serine/arginine repetitive matrix protein 3-like [Mustela erminea]|uniref:serine/arginine repetitive matrix protein 3-like n=1 Tax=Mustela erminea TaxID=36723 RepID=UPI0013870088|nr:serine/arginine repetitive matrix protein 3-like [Mustela erminea]
MCPPPPRYSAPMLIPPYPKETKGTHILGAGLSASRNPKLFLRMPELGKGQRKKKRLPVTRSCDVSHKDSEIPTSPHQSYMGMPNYHPPIHTQAETDKDAGVHCSRHTPPSANSTSTTPVTPISSAAQQNRKTHPGSTFTPPRTFSTGNTQRLGKPRSATHRSADHTGTHTQGRGRACYAHTVNYPAPQRAPTEPLREPSTPPPHRTRTNTRGDRRTAAVGEASQNPIDTHTHELYTKPRGAHIRTRRSTLLYPKFHAENPRTPAASRTTRPPARSSHPLLLPLTTNAAGLGQAGPGRAAPVAERPGGPRRPGSSGTGVRPGPLAACPSAGPRGQASSPLPAIHAWGPRPPAGPRRSRSAA